MKKNILMTFVIFVCLSILPLEAQEKAAPGNEAANSPQPGIVDSALESHSQDQANVSALLKEGRLVEADRLL